MSGVQVLLQLRTRRHSVAWACGLLLSAPAGTCWAQSLPTSSGPGLRITPTFGAEASYIHSTGAGIRIASGDDFVTRLSPGIRVTSRSGRVRGTFDYRLSAIHHTGRVTTDEPNIQNELNAVGTAEIIENRLFVDASANVAQNARSPYGTQSFGNTRSDSNRIEIARVRIAPRTSGNLGGIASYNVALNAEAINGRNSIEADSTNRGAVASVASANNRSIFGWGLQASTQTSDFRAGRATRNDRYFVTLSARPDTDWYSAVRLGQESTNVLGLRSQSYNNYGIDVRWTPSPRTTASASWDKRYFGNGYSVLLEHRFRRSSLRFTSTRDANEGSGATGVGQPISLYALFYSQFATAQPDPALRDLLVRDFLRAQGLDPGLLVGGGFVSSLVTLQRREDLAYSYAGLRNTFTLQAFSNRTQTLDRVSGAPSNGAVTQYGFTTTVSHRLTPTSSANLTAADLRTPSGGQQGSNELRTVVISLNEQLSRMISGALSVRYSDFDSSVQPYRESAISASVAVRF